jgi:hypothetical protein
MGCENRSSSSCDRQLLDFVMRRPMLRRYLRGTPQTQDMSIILHAGHSVVPDAALSSGPRVSPGVDFNNLCPISSVRLRGMALT